MSMLAKRIVRLSLLGLLVAGVWAGLGAGVATALEVGEQAPNFKLPSTNGVDISLNDFRGKTWIFLEFYGAAFAPT